MADTAQTWQRRPMLATALRVAIAIVPVATAIAVGWITGDWLRDHNLIVSVLASTAAGTVAYVAMARVMRRALPLSMLLGLALRFPGDAPSRFSVAMRSGSVRKLEQWAHERDATDAGAALAASEALALVTALNTHDRRTRGHSERVRALADLIGDEMNLTDDHLYRLRWGALLHDIGKMSVPTEILNKRGKPNDHEWATLQGHPAAGAVLARPLSDFMGEWIHAIDGHHERVDGTGYPHGLAGANIALSARIVAVADAYETMTAVRSYKRAMSPGDARAELERCAGTHFDPTVVRAFLSVSLPRVNRVMGPVASLAHLPIVGPATRTAVTLSGVATVPTEAAVRVAAVAAMTAAASNPIAAAAHTTDNTGTIGDLAAVVIEDNADEEATADDEVTGDVNAREVSTAPDRNADDEVTGDPHDRTNGRDQALEDDGEIPHRDKATPKRLPTDDAADDGDDRDSSTSPERSPVDATVDEVTDTTGTVTKRVTDTVDTNVDDVTETTDDTVDVLTDTVDDLTGNATSPLTDPVDDTVDDVTDTLNDTVDDTVDDVTGTLDDTVDDVLGLAGDEEDSSGGLLRLPGLG